MTELGKRLMERGESKKVIEIVKNSIKNGLDNKMISSITGLTIDKIQGIREAIEYEEEQYSEYESSFIFSLYAGVNGAGKKEDINILKAIDNVRDRIYKRRFFGLCILNSA